MDITADHGATSPPGEAGSVVVVVLVAEAVSVASVAEASVAAEPAGAGNLDGEMVRW